MATRPIAIVKHFAETYCHRHARCFWFKIILGRARQASILDHKFIIAQAASEKNGRQYKIRNNNGKDADRYTGTNEVHQAAG